MSSERVVLNLRDIVENVERIERHIAGRDFAAFELDEMIVDAVERCLQRISEAVIRIGPDRMARIAPDLPSEAVRGLGNILRHEYHRIDLRVVWETVTERLPGLKVDCLRALVDEDQERSR